jgi:hypothetical protein
MASTSKVSAIGNPQRHQRLVRGRVLDGGAPAALDRGSGSGAVAAADGVGDSGDAGGSVVAVTRRLSAPVPDLALPRHGPPR